MIIDSPVLTSIAVGAGRVIPQDGDAQMVLPAVVTPTIITMQPSGVFSSSNGNDFGSNFTTLELTKNNVAAGSSQLQLMPKGLYEVNVMLAIDCDFTAAPMAAVSIRFTLNAINILGRLATLYCRTGAQSIAQKYRILAVGELKFEVNWPITGVADTIIMTASVNAVRIL